MRRAALSFQMCDSSLYFPTWAQTEVTAEFRQCPKEINAYNFKTIHNENGKSGLEDLYNRVGHYL